MPVAYDDIPPRLRPDMDSYEHCLQCGSTISKENATYDGHMWQEQETGAIQDAVSVHCPTCESTRIQRRFNGEIRHPEVKRHGAGLIWNKPTIPSSVPEAIVIELDPIKLIHSETEAQIEVRNPDTNLHLLGQSIPIKETDQTGVYEERTIENYFGETRRVWDGTGWTKA